jgi:hypothetical protein
LAGIAAVIALVVGLGQIRVQIQASAQERELALHALNKQIEHANTERQQTREMFEVDVILKLEDRFGDLILVQRRLHAASFLRSPPPNDDPRWDDLNDLIDFFQVVGTITKLNHLRIELTYKWFSYWLLHYYAACKDYISAQRESSPVIWKDLVDLYSQMIEFDKKNNNGHLSNLTEEDLQKFLVWEDQVLRAHYKVVAVRRDIDATPGDAN